MLQKLPARSTDALLDIAVEDLEEVRNELPPLLVRYWREVGDPEVQIDPDWQGLLRQSSMGNVVLVIARHEDTMVGFALNLVHGHVSFRTVPHMTTVWIWLDPAYRVGREGYNFIKENLRFVEEKLKSLEAPLVRTFIAAPNEGTATLYERAGYKFGEAAYAKVLKCP